jgi:hypothetical protein
MNARRARAVWLGRVCCGAAGDRGTGNPVSGDAGSAATWLACRSRNHGNTAEASVADRSTGPGNCLSEHLDRTWPLCEKEDEEVMRSWLRLRTCYGTANRGRY